MCWPFLCVGCVHGGLPPWCNKYTGATGSHHSFSLPLLRQSVRVGSNHILSGMHVPGFCAAVLCKASFLFPWPGHNHAIQVTTSSPCGTHNPRPNVAKTEASWQICQLCLPLWTGATTFSVSPSYFNKTTPKTHFTAGKLKHLKFLLPLKWSVFSLCHMTALRIWINPVRGGGLC